MKNLCVFCGSSFGTNPKFTELAKDLGEKIVSNSMGLVYGGGSIGLMGAVADSVLNKKGSVIGVIPKKIVELEVGHEGLKDLIIVDSMHERKNKMYDFSDAFVAIPGGMGTLDEFCEIITWAQLEYHKKPCYILNSEGFFDHLLAHFKFINKEGFLSTPHLELVQIVDSVDSLMSKLKNL